MEPTSPLTPLRAGDFVYCRAGLEGFTDGRACLTLLDKSGKPVSDATYYVPAEALIPGQTVVMELRARSEAV